MQKKSYQWHAILLLIFLIVGSAVMYALGMVASSVEKVIGFLSSAINYPIIIALFLTFRGVDLLGYRVRKHLSIWFVVVTLLEGIVPVFIYADQQTPNDYYTMLALQILLNLYIAKVITCGFKRIE